MIEIAKYIYRLLYRFILKRKNVKIAFSTRFNRSSIFEGFNVIHEDSVVSNTSLGYATYIGSRCTLHNCKIGRFCSIANNVEIIYSRHPTSKFVSTHPAFFSTNKQCGFSYATQDTFNESNLINGRSAIIGNDVWIGANAKIIEGTKIGDGAIIAAGSYVVKDVPDYAIVGGVPAKILKYRFSKDKIDGLLKIKWWYWDLRKIKKFSEKFNDIDNLLNELDS